MTHNWRLLTLLKFFNYNPRQKLGWLSAGGVALVLLLGAASHGVAATQGVATDFRLPDLQGKATGLSEYKGRPIILKLGTTWCPACVEQSAVFLHSGAELKKRDVVVVEVYLKESAAAVAKVQTETVPYERVVLVDDGRVQREYGVYTIPRVILIDREFQIFRDGSLLDGRQLLRTLDEMSFEKRKP